MAKTGCAGRIKVDYSVGARFASSLHASHTMIDPAQFIRVRHTAAAAVALAKLECACAGCISLTHTHTLPAALFEPQAAAK